MVSMEISSHENSPSTVESLPGFKILNEVLPDNSQIPKNYDQVDILLEFFQMREFLICENLAYLNKAKLWLNKFTKNCFSICKKDPIDVRYFEALGI